MQVMHHVDRNLL